MKIKTYMERMAEYYALGDAPIRTSAGFMQEEILELRAEVERLTQKSIEDSWRGVPSWQQGGA